MFFIILSISMIAAYFFLQLFLVYFFEGKITNIKINYFHICLIIIGFFICIAFSQFFSGEFGNRLQHALGGGFMMSLIFFLAYKQSRIHIQIFQFFVLSVLIATIFGVANELAESLAQNTIGMIFSQKINDTWYDLWANFFGTLLGTIIFSFLLLKNESR